jgi:hypothetical protein
MTVFNRDAAGPETVETAVEPGQDAVISLWDFDEASKVPGARTVYPHVDSTPAPAFVNGFVKAAARIEGVRCIVFEKSEDGLSEHVTVFADAATDHDSVYQLEMDTVAAHPDLLFDFHLRRSDEVTGTTPALAATSHYYVVWGALGDADHR